MKTYLINKYITSVYSKSKPIQYLVGFNEYSTLYPEANPYAKYIKCTFLIVSWLWALLTWHKQFIKYLYNAGLL